MLCSAFLYLCCFSLLSSVHSAKVSTVSQLCSLVLYDPASVMFLSPDPLFLMLPPVIVRYHLFLSCLFLFKPKQQGHYYFWYWNISKCILLLVSTHKHNMTLSNQTCRDTCQLISGSVNCRYGVFLYPLQCCALLLKDHWQVFESRAPLSLHINRHINSDRKWRGKLPWSTFILEKKQDISILSFFRNLSCVI